MEDRTTRIIRAERTNFQTRDDNNVPSIEGYFVVFNSTYDIGDGMSESVAPGTFTRTLSQENVDVLALDNHDTTLVLGRTTANTLHLVQDDHGLWGRVDINPKDVSAMNLYERVKRGDVHQCSFGFCIREEDTEVAENGDVHWTIKDVDLFEVSICGMPAYKETSVQARSDERKEILKRKSEAWAQKMKERLRNGNQSTDAPQED